MNKHPIAIATADWHLRPDKPRCRIDKDWLKTQEDKLDAILKLHQELDVPILNAGDLLHRHEVPHWFETWVYERLVGARMFFTPGQHDLPKNNLDLFDQSATHHILTTLNLLHDLDSSEFEVTCFPYGAELKPAESLDGVHIALVHTLVYNKKPFPGAPTDGNISIIQKKLRGFDFAVCGDNHVPLVVEGSEDKPVIVNPGPLTRQSADNSFRPRVYVLYSDFSVKAIPLPAKKTNVSRKHIEKEKERKKRTNVFVEGLAEDIDADIDFLKNLGRYVKKKKAKKSIRKKVFEAAG